MGPVSLFKRYSLYTRQEVASILAPDYPFQRQRGTWGAHGIVKFWDEGNFVFFVTFGQSQAGHDFDEGISEEGLLRWHSQPSQDLNNQQIRQFILHNEDDKNILLFLRKKKNEPYAFLGPLKYIQHDNQRECPVHFQWKILGFDPGDPRFVDLGIRIEREAQERAALDPEVPPNLWVASDSGALVMPPIAILVENEPPRSREAGLRAGVTTREFRGCLVDYEERDRKNRNLGRLGEELVLQFEKHKLIQAGQKRLAEKVEHVARTRGDGLGFDVLSFDPETKSELHIEVKTTQGPASTPFFMSAGEVEYARRCEQEYQLIRLYEFASSASRIPFFSLESPLEEKLLLRPTHYRAKLR